MGVHPRSDSPPAVRSDRPSADDPARHRASAVADGSPDQRLVSTGAGGVRGRAASRLLACGLGLVLLLGILPRLFGCGDSGLGGSGSQPGEPAILLPAGCPTGASACGRYCVPEGFSCPGPDAGSTNNLLSQLVFSAGSLSPEFSPATTVYTLVLPGSSPTTLQVTPTAVDPATPIYVNGSRVPSGMASAPVPVGIGVTMITVATEPTGTTRRTYDIAVQRSIYAKAPNTGPGDLFGSAISLSGDTLAIAAPQEDSGARGSDGNQSDNSALDSGAVYVFVRTATSWTLQAYLKSSNSDAGDRFGSAVALSGDSLAVGASGEDSASSGNPADNSLSGSGAVYVFVRVGGSWQQQAYLKASNPDANDAFGTSLSLAGDTLAVAATGEASRATGVNGNQLDNTASGSGAVYVFVRSAGTWTQQAYLKASNTDSADAFGFSVAVDADTLAVGAPGEASSARGIDGNQGDNTASSAGAVYIFVRAGSTWTQQAYVKASNAGAKDLFGRSVALSADSLAVGATAEASSAVGVNGNQLDDSLPLSGAVYVFTRTASVWSQQAYVKASNPGASDFFGSSVSLAGDWLAVGAPGESSSARGAGGDQTNNSLPGAGAVYLFLRSGTGWTQQTYQKATNTAARDELGSAVSLAAGTVVAGAPGEDSSGTGINGAQSPRLLADSGAAFICLFGP